MTDAVIKGYTMGMGEQILRCILMQTWTIRHRFREV